MKDSLFFLHKGKNLIYNAQYTTMIFNIEKKHYICTVIY